MGLTCEYGAHILSVYHHTTTAGWLTVNQKEKGNQNPKAHLEEGDTWQARQLKGAARKELDLWLR